MTDNESLKQVDEKATTEPAFNIAFAVLLLIAACTIIHIARQYLLSPMGDNYVLFYGAFIPLRYANAETAMTIEAFTSPLTYSFLHGSFGHLFNNILWLVVFGSPLARTIGNARFLVFWAIAAIVAAGFHYLSGTTSQNPMIGASGAIAGMMGAAARFGFQMSGRGQGQAFNPHIMSVGAALANRNILLFLIVYLGINFATGYASVTPTGESALIAWQAHIGGLVAGFFLLPLFLRHRSDTSHISS